MDETVDPRKTELSSRTDAISAEPKKPGLELLIGSNIFRNTNGVVKIHGKEQLVVEPKPEQGVLLVTIDLYSEAGIHIAHLRRNVLVLNQAGQFAVNVHRTGTELPSDAPWVRVLDQHTGAIVFEASVVSEAKVQITGGKFCSHKGIPVEITPHYCRIGSGMTRFGDIVENQGGTVVLG